MPPLPPPPYKFGDPAPGFFDKQRVATISLQLKLGSVLSQLAQDPMPDTEELRALPLIDHRLANGYTVTFDDGDAMLIYQVREDLRAIILIDLIWV
jgi:mRNA-degrading endonuclease YafQ of YafQ-DinJ toxin-antitoxin module